MELAYTKIWHLFNAIENQNMSSEDQQKELKKILTEMKTEVSNSAFNSGLRAYKKELDEAMEKLKKPQ